MTDTTAPRSVLLVEDNGGGLHMLVMEGDRCTEACSDLEQAPAGQMRDDMAGALADGMGDWSGLADDPQVLHDSLIEAVEAGSGGALIVAEGDRLGITVHADRMGAAAGRYASDAAALLRRVGEALYGPRWQTDLAGDLRVSDRTMRRWAAGTDEVPPGVWLDLGRLAADRREALHAIEAALRQRGG